MTGFQYGINWKVDSWVFGGLCTGFNGDLYGIKLGIYEVIDLVFSDRYFEVCSGGNIEGLVTGFQDGTHVNVSACLPVFLGKTFDEYAYGIKFGIDKVIELCCSYRYFEVFSDDKYWVWEYTGSGWLKDG